MATTACCVGTTTTSCRTGLSLPSLFSVLFCLSANYSVFVRGHQISGSTERSTDWTKHCMQERTFVFLSSTSTLLFFEITFIIGHCKVPKKFPFGFVLFFDCLCWGFCLVFVSYIKGMICICMLRTQPSMCLTLSTSFCVETKPLRGVSRVAP